MHLIFLHQLRAELLLSFQQLRVYWFNQLASLVADTVFFFAIAMGIRALAAGTEVPLSLGNLLLLYAAFGITVGMFQSIAFTLHNEATRGTLEHLALARGGLLRQLFLRALADTFFNVLYNGVVFLLLVLLLGVRLEPTPWFPLALLPVALSAMGFGFLMGTLALYFKQVMGLFTILQFLLLPYFFTLAAWQPFMAYLPFAPGAHLLKLGLTGGAFDPGVFLLALLQGVLLLSLGLLAMGRMYALVRHKGLLGRY